MPFLVCPLIVPPPFSTLGRVPNSASVTNVDLAPSSSSFCQPFFGTDGEVPTFRGRLPRTGLFPGRRTLSCPQPVPLTPFPFFPSFSVCAFLRPPFLIRKVPVLPSSLAPFSRCFPPFLVLPPDVDDLIGVSLAHQGFFSPYPLPFTAFFLWKRRPEISEIFDPAAPEEVDFIIGWAPLKTRFFDVPALSGTRWIRVPVPPKFLPVFVPDVREFPSSSRIVGLLVGRSFPPVSLGSLSPTSPSPPTSRQTWPCLDSPSYKAVADLFSTGVSFF